MVRFWFCVFITATVTSTIVCSQCASKMDWILLDEILRAWHKFEHAL